MGSSVSNDFDIDKKDRPKNTTIVGKVILNGVAYKNLMRLGADERGLYVGPNRLNFFTEAKLIPWSHVEAAPDRRVLFATYKRLVLDGYTELAVHEWIYKHLSIDAFSQRRHGSRRSSRRA